MRGFNDFNNPYWDDYQIWDDWIYRHAVDTEFDPNRVASLWVDSQSLYFETIIGYVDEAGFLLPLLEVEEQRLRAAREPGGPAQPFHEPIVAQGILSPEVSAALDEALLAIQAEYSLEVPDWLANEPPHWAMLWDDGRIITHGVRDSGGTGSPTMGLYCIYTHEGMLLQQVVADEWWELFWPDWQAYYADSDANSYRERDGWVYLFKRVEGEPTRLVELRNYDGRREADVSAGDTRSMLQFNRLEPADLIEFRDMQVRIRGRST